MHGYILQTPFNWSVFVFAQWISNQQKAKRKRKTGRVKVIKAERKTKQLRREVERKRDKILHRICFCSFLFHLLVISLSFCDASAPKSAPFMWFVSELWFLMHGLDDSQRWNSTDLSFVTLEGDPGPCASHPSAWKSGLERKIKIVEVTQTECNFLKGGEKKKTWGRGGFEPEPFKQKCSSWL